MGYNFSPKITLTDIRVCLDAANPKSYPGTGTLWSDLTRYKNDGTLINGPSFSTSNLGNIYLDGSNDYVNLGSSSSGSSNSSFTVEAFVKCTDLSNKSFVSRGRDGAGSGWSMNLGTSTGNVPAFGVVTTSPFTSYYAISDNPLSINVWYHLVGVYTYSSSVKLYVNGILDKTTSAPGLTLRSSTEGFIVGSITTTSFYQFNIANLKIYYRPLTDSEILENFNSLKNRFGI